MPQTPATLTPGKQEPSHAAHLPFGSPLSSNAKWDFTGNKLREEIDAWHYVESTNVSERKRAYDYALNRIIGVRREKMKPYLIHVVRKGAAPEYRRVNGEEDEYASRRVALSILAEWQDPSLVPLFLEFIAYQALDPNRSNTTDSIGKEPCHDFFAAVKGLIKIGHPALEPTVRELIKTTIPDERIRNLDPLERDTISTRYENLIYVIWCILGYEGAKDYFSKEIEKVSKTDPRSAGMLREALKYLEMNYRKRWNG